MQNKKSKVDPLYELYDMFRQDMSGLKVDVVVHIMMPLLMVYLTYITMIYLNEEYKIARERRQEEEQKEDQNTSKKEQ